MARLFDRRCRLTLYAPQPDIVAPKGLQVVQQVEIGGDGDTSVGLRVQFKIHKNEEKDPNTSEITVTNLSESTRQSLQKKNVRAILEAGYATTGMSRIFVGDARSVDHVRNGADFDTILRLGSGERAIRFARAQESFAPGTPAGAVLRFLVGQSGLASGNAEDVARVLDGRTLQQGYLVEGKTSNSLDRFLKSVGYRWSVQDEALQILLPGQSVAVQIPEVSADTGLIGSPEMGCPEKKGKPALVKFKTLLLPTRPGGRVRLRSERYNGQVRVKKCTFDGDTRSQTWYTEIEGVIEPGTAAA